MVWRCCINLARPGDIYAQWSGRASCYQIRFLHKFWTFDKKVHRDIRNTCEPKVSDPLKNWIAYNAGLINRGNVTMWIDEAIFARMPATAPHTPRVGCPCLYGAIRPFWF
ncbi:MAG: hypothetical protein E5299_00196 [Burkholderia gladioli]|nr:MAG: hypothetical protein E5299_00196 [Burkholderia gladioli]